MSVLLVGLEGKQPYLHVLKAEVGYVSHAYSLIIVRSTHIQIGELLAFYSSKWELGNGGVIYTDFDSIGDRIQVLIYELKLREMQARIGVAPSRFASFVAAHAADVETPLFISPVQLEAFLADQSVSYLPISGKNQERLEVLGLRTLGQVAHIDIRELVNQFGREGQFMSELARGIDSMPLPSKTPAHRRGR